MVGNTWMASVSSLSLRHCIAVSSLLFGTHWIPHAQICAWTMNASQAQTDSQMYAEWQKGHHLGEWRALKFTSRKKWCKRAHLPWKMDNTGGTRGKGNLIIVLTLLSFVMIETKHQIPNQKTLVWDLTVCYSVNFVCPRKCEWTQLL